MKRTFPSRFTFLDVRGDVDQSSGFTLSSGWGGRGKALGKWEPVVGTAPVGLGLRLPGFQDQSSGGAQDRCRNGETVSLTRGSWFLPTRGLVVV